MAQADSITPRSSTPITSDLIAEHGLTVEEYEQIVAILGRDPNLLELGIFSVMWSEHCSYKTTRVWLKTLPTDAPHVICGPGENAGVIDIGDGQACIFKIESHNHPSFIEPFQGAATGVGGILRDVFTMGARPVALLNALSFGHPEHPKTRHLLQGVVSGISSYGNCVGVPTVGGECRFHPTYNQNNLVNAMCVGVADTNKIFYSEAKGIGNPVVYVGSKTGRDGIHGATMASAEFDDQTEEKRPTVQVGDPFTEKLLIEACLELMATDAIIAIQDMGAAGMTCSSLEMADKGGLGIDLHLDRVPQREEGMTPYEIMLSESQERMLMVLKPDAVEKAEAIFRKWDLDYATVGTLTDSGHMVLRWHGEVVGNMPVAPISGEAPQYRRPYVPTPAAKEVTLEDINWDQDIGVALGHLLQCPDVVSKRWIWQQYDHQVMNDTVACPGGDAAMVRVHGSKKGLAMSTDVTPRYCISDPAMGGKHAVVETYRNISATGATPLAITNCLNFGNPEKKEIMGQLVGCIQGMAEACEALEYPVVSGNVSLYNETNGEAISPTPTIGGVGLIDDVSKRLGNSFTQESDSIFIIGNTHGHMGASLYLREIAGREEGPPPAIDLIEERKHAAFIRSMNELGFLSACHDVSDGGMLVAIAEMCFANNIGANIHFPLGLDYPLAYAFGEDQGRYIISVPPHFQDEVLLSANRLEIPITDLGNTGGDMLVVEGITRVAIEHLKGNYENWLSDYMAA